MAKFNLRGGYKGSAYDPANFNNVFAATQREIDQRNKIIPIAIVFAVATGAALYYGIPAVSQMYYPVQAPTIHTP